MTQTTGKVWVGVGIIVENDNNEILMMRRKSKHGLGQYSIPGGAVEAGENLTQSAIRELQEETGIQAHDLSFIGVTNNIKTYHTEGLHVVSLVFHTKQFSGEPKLREKDKHEHLDWYPDNQLPQPQFEASDLAMQPFSGKSDLSENVGIIDICISTKQP